jgi:hypothetical protein
MSVVFEDSVISKGRFRCMSNRNDLNITDTDSGIESHVFEVYVLNDNASESLLTAFQVVKDQFGNFYKDFSSIFQRFLTYDFLVPNIMDGMQPATLSEKRFLIKINGSTELIIDVNNSFLTILEWKRSTWTDFLIAEGDTNKLLHLNNYNNSIELDRSFVLHCSILDNTNLRGFKITTYDATDTPIGGGTILATSPPLYSLQFSTRWYAQVGTKDLIDYFGATFLDGVFKYKVEVEFNDLSVASVPVWFTIVDYCGKYSNMRLHWLNQYGGFDAFDFTKKTIITQNVQKNTYKNKETFIQAGLIEDNIQLNTTNYVKQSNKYVINSDWCSDSEAIAIDSLLNSRVVFAELGGFFYGVNVLTSSMVRKNSNNDMLFNYELEISLQDDTFTTL